MRIKPIVSVNKEEYDCSVISMNSSHLKVNKLLDLEFHRWFCSLVVSSVDLLSLGLRFDPVSGKSYIIDSLYSLSTLQATIVKKFQVWSGGNK